MDGRPIYGPDALEDLDGILRYTSERWGVEQARVYIREIERRCRSIAAGKARVVAVTTYDRAYGMTQCGNHRILFSKAVDTEIIAILHERMDLIRRLEAGL